MNSKVKEESNTKMTSIKGILRGFLPILEWGAVYNRQKAINDLVVAIIVSIMLVPQSLAYAQLAGLPPEVGPMNSIDASGLESLKSINQRLIDSGIVFHLSEVKGPIMDSHRKQNSMRSSRTGFILPSLMQYQVLIQV